MAHKIVEATTLRIGSYLLLEGEAYIIKSLDVSKTGKHGHAKVRLEAIGMVDGQKKIVVAPAHDKVEVPIVLKKSAQVLSINNNIANVMGVFINSSPFNSIQIGRVFHITSIQQLFLLGGIAIAIGVFTYSKGVMMTVGSDIFKLSPITAFVVVLASSSVLFIFASQTLKTFLESFGLPSFPLVPVSSSQAVVGAVMGICIAKGGKNIHLQVIGKICIGWLATPVVSAIISYITLFFMQNVFMQDIL